MKLTILLFLILILVNNIGCVSYKHNSYNLIRTGAWSGSEIIGNFSNKEECEDQKQQLSKLWSYAFACELVP